VICPIGPVDRLLLHQLARRITARCGLLCRVSSTKLDNPRYAYNETRRQYDSKTILHCLKQRSKEKGEWVLGVTSVDLYVPILKFVFGLAEVEGRCALISLHRLRPEFYDAPPQDALLLERMEKTALHELGHALGLTHCRDRRCVMYSSTHIEHTDQKGPEFCPSCGELFKWRVRKQKERGD